MVRTVFHKLGTDLRFQVAFGLLGVAVSVMVALATERLAEGAIVLNLFAIVVGGAKYRHEQSSLNR